MLSSPDWHFRPIEQQDIPAIAALFDAADRADHLYKLSSEEDIRESFAEPPAGSETRIIVVDAAPESALTSGTLLGIGRVSPTFRTATRERIYSVLLRVHPSARHQGLQHVIARHLIEIARATESNPSTEHANRVRVRTYIFDTQTSSIEAWESLGLRRERTGWTMCRPLDEPIESTRTPDTITLRTYRHPDDNAQAVQAFNSAFSDYYDSYPVSEASWEREMAASYSRPEFSWLAFSQDAPGRTVGLAVCWVNDGENRQTGRLEGWVEGIGVIPAFRQRGIGKALLANCLQSLHTAGLQSALADVDSGSTPAVKLFRSAGFTVRSALLQYECLLEDVQL